MNLNDPLAQDIATERIEEEIYTKYQEIKDCLDRYVDGKLTATTYLLETEKLCDEIKSLLVRLTEV